MTNVQFYLAVGLPIIVSVLGFTMIGIMLLWLKGDIRETNTNLGILTTKVADIDNRVIRIEERLKI